MKKSIFMSLLAAVSLGMATVSCSSDNTEDGQGGSGSGKMETYTISCSFDKDTRMMLDANATPRQYKWENNDQITVWNASGNKIATGVLTEGAGTKDGKFKFASSETAKYVTFVSGGTGGSVTTEGKQITIDPVQTYASTDDISGLPIMAQGELTEVTGDHHVYTTKLVHKMSFLKFGTITYSGSATDLTISGTNKATINPTSGAVTSDATYTNSTIAAANVTSGKMIAVFPGCNFAAAVHGKNILNNPDIKPNLIYSLNDRNITPYTVTVAAGAGGSVSIEKGTGDPTISGFTATTDNTTATATIKATPTNTDYEFSGWFDGENSTALSQNATINISAYNNKTLTAHFKAVASRYAVDYFMWDAKTPFQPFSAVTAAAQGDSWYNDGAYANNWGYGPVFTEAEVEAMGFDAYIDYYDTPRYEVYVPTNWWDSYAPNSPFGLFHWNLNGYTKTVEGDRTKVTTDVGAWIKFNNTGVKNVHNNTDEWKAVTNKSDYVLYPFIGYFNTSAQLWELGYEGRFWTSTPGVYIWINTNAQCGIVTGADKRLGCPVFRKAGYGKP